MPSLLDYELPPSYAHSGDMKYGVAQGVGTVSLPNGISLEGPFVEGFMHGEVKFSLPGRGNGSIAVAQGQPAVTSGSEQPVYTDPYYIHRSGDPGHHPIEWTWCDGQEYSIPWNYCRGDRRLRCELESGILAHLQHVLHPLGSVYSGSPEQAQQRVFPVANTEEIIYYCWSRCN